MSTTTTNFGWTVPSDTDLVKDGAAAIRTALGGVDTSFVDLKGGTTGQVLSKASGTDLDFTWVAQDDSNAIQNAIVDAKGDLIAATAADTPARLAVGTNGQVLTADSTAATGLAWATPSGGGGMTSLASGSLSGSSLSLTSISGSYKNLQLILRDAQPSTNTDWRIRINNNTGSIYDRLGTIASGSTFTSYATESGTAFGINWNNPRATSPGAAACINFFDYAKTTSYKQIQCLFSYEKHGGGQDNVFMQGDARDANAITRIDVILDSGNFTAGTYILYGVN